jgi:hypothetical protein
MPPDWRDIRGGTALPNLKANTAILGAFAGAWTIASMRKMLCVAIVSTMVVGAPAPASAKSIFDRFKAIVTAPVKVIKAVVGVSYVARVSASKIKSDLTTAPDAEAAPLKDYDDPTRMNIRDSVD